MGRPRSPQQSKKTPIAKKAHTRTAGEALFETYLHQNGYLDYDFEPEIPGSKQKPDYRLRTRAGEFFTDVKDFEPDDVIENGAGGAFDPHSRIRKRIEKLREKFKSMRGNVPCVGVLHSPGVATDVYLDDAEVMIPAMRGNMTIEIPFDEKTQMFDSSRTSYGLGAGAQMQPNKNTTISALLTLRKVPIGEFRIERHLNRIAEQREPTSGDAFEDLGPEQEAQPGLIVWENPYATNPLPRSIFCGPYDERWGVDGADGKYKRLFVGEGLALMERERDSAENRPHKARPKRPPR
jgi:hypothetical protein